MAFTLPELPYPLDGLEPHISQETLEFHHGKHHRAYVDKLNGLIMGSAFEEKSLLEIMKDPTSKGSIFNNAAQVWNHSFYWNCLSPNGGGQPTDSLLTLIDQTFGSFENFKEKFSQTAITTFGSGWTWLVKNHQGQLEIISTSNAGNPITEGHTPLLTCDVWEHAYYIDYRNARPKYVDIFWNLVNWEFVASQLT